MYTKSIHDFCARPRGEPLGEETCCIDFVYIYILDIILIHILDVILMDILDVLIRKHILDGLLPRPLERPLERSAAEQRGCVRLLSREG